MFKKVQKNKKILKVEYPLLTSYPHIANILAIYGNNPYLETVLLSEMSELVFDRDYDRLDFSIALDIELFMNNYPLCYIHGLGREFINKNWDDPIKFIKSSIDDGYYVQMLVDTYYISAYELTYSKQHYLHDIMIYGYDEKEEVFNVADCFVNGKYAFELSSFNEIKNSFLSTFNGDWLYGVRLVKIKEEQYKGIGYNPYYITEACKRYLNNEKSSAVTCYESRRRYDMGDRFVHGISIYDEILDYIDDWESENGWKNYDIKIFYVLYDHIKMFRHITKQLMMREQIINAAQVYDGFLDVENRIKNLYMLVMKYNISGKEKDRESLKEKLSDIKNLEKECIESFIKNINISKDDMKADRPSLLKPEVIEADSIFVEFDQESHWKRKNVTDRTMHTNVKDAYIKTQFYGSGLKLEVTKKKSYGQAVIYVDNEQKCIIDYANDEGIHTEVIGNLESGYHWVKIQNISNNGEMINLGKIEIIHCDSKKSDNENECRLLDVKKSCGDNLLKKYGNAGYEKMCYRRKLPEYLTSTNYTVNNAIYMSIIYDKADRRGVLESKEDDKKIAAYAFDDNEFWIDMTIPGKAREISFYSVDYDYFARVMDIIIEDADTGQVLFEDRAQSFSEGILFKFLLKGHVIIRFKKVEGPDVVLNAVLFD